MVSDQSLISINITLDIYSFVTVSIILIYMLIRYKKHFFNNKWLYYTFITTQINIFSDIFTWVCLGTKHSWYPICLKISTFIFYFTSYILMCFFFFYLLDFICKSKKLKKITRNFFIATIFFYSFLLICTPFTGFLYVIDEANYYSRGKLFFIPVILQITMYLNLIFVIIKNKKYINFKNLLPTFSFIVFPQMMQLIQLKTYGVSLISTGYTISFIIIFFDMNLKLTNELKLSDEEINRKNIQLIEMQDKTIVSLSSLVEERDTDTGGHVQRTSEYVLTIAKLLQKENLFPDEISTKYINYLKSAAPMHDIGKIVIPDAVLKKPGKLTPEEFEIMKLHTTEGKRIIGNVFKDNHLDEDNFRITGEVATYHHEKWNGTGYPTGLSETQIPLSARIMAMADVFDALVSPRIYKEPMSYEKAFQIIEEGRGTQFDPIITDIFLKNKDLFISINEKYKNLF